MQATNRKHRQKRIFVIITIVFLLSVTSAFLIAGSYASAPIHYQNYDRFSDLGTPVGLTKLGQYSGLEFRLLLTLAGGLPEPISIQHGATLYRLEYWTQTPDGFPTLASGLLAIPHTNKPLRGVVLYHHGTNPDRNQSPSKPTRDEGVLGALIFASADYLFLAPDYIGLGTSQEVHPYLHPQSEAQAALDLLRAARTVLGEAPFSRAWPNDVYLTGFSQGGQAAMATQRRLQELNDPHFQVAANASISGPYLLFNSDQDSEQAYAFENAIFGEEWSHTMYLAFAGYAYCKIYNEPLDSLFTAEWASTIPAYFNGNRSVDDIIDLFTRETTSGEREVVVKARDLLAPEFLDAYTAYRQQAGEAPWLIERLRENVLPITVGWAPEAPVRLYYGEADTDVPPIESLTAARLLGENVTAISVGDYAHGESVYQAIPEVRNWFDELSADEE